jgi:WD40 repeat protein
VKVLDGTPHVVRALAVNGTGGGAVSGGDDGAIRVWNLVTAKEEFSLAGHAGPVRGVTFSPNGQYLLSGGQDGTLRLWDLQSREAVRNFKIGQPVTCVAFCPDGRRALVGADSGLIAIYDLEAATPLHRTTGHINAAVTSVAFSMDGREAVSVGDDKRLLLWDVVTGARLKIGGDNGPTGIVTSQTQSPQAVAYIGDGSWIIAANGDSTAAIVQPHAKGRTKITLPQAGKPISLAVATDGSAAYFGTDRGAVRRMDFQGGADFVDTNAGR